MNILVTGGAGFIGSHVAERYARAGSFVTVLDNVSRGETLATADRRPQSLYHNWRHLEQMERVSLVRGDVRDAALVRKLAADADAIVHTAAQVAVTSSLQNPRTDFEINALGTLNVLEAARLAHSAPSVVIASTNKVYGSNVNRIPVEVTGNRYCYADDTHANGIAETLGIDGCEHSPYGVSKLAADLYGQDYAYVYGLRTGVFRMSCIYGPRQFGNEDQGWIAHFILSALQDRPLIVYGDGRQVRDVLYVDDLVTAYDAFLRSTLHHGVWNVGGGPSNTLSLLELLDLVHRFTGKRPPVTFGPWRAGDQRVYISDTRRAQAELDWSPSIGPSQGIRAYATWAMEVAAR